jgi:hypothetical protein
MTGVLQLTEQANPLAQTFRVNEPGGSVITSVGLFFQSAPTVSDLQLPITVELRPVVDGRPSSTRFIPGARTFATASQIRSVASATFSDATEYKFTFNEPTFIPENTEIAIIAYTNAKVNQYKIWAGTLGEHISGSTTKLVTHQLDAGVFYQSSNGTSWSADQFTDIAFKVYRAEFLNVYNEAYLIADVPPVKHLTENTYIDDYIKYPSDPLIFTAGSTQMKVIHPSHGFIVGDKVTLSADSSGFNNATSIYGITGADILGTRSIVSADPFGYTVTIGAAPNKTARGGGIGIMATEQYVIDQMILGIPRITPPNTSMNIVGNFTTTKSFAGNETPYNTTTNVALIFDEPIIFKDPHVVASLVQENEPTKLNSNPSTIIKVKMRTSNKYAAPYFNVLASSLKVLSNFIDYQDSDNSSVSNRNYITTIDYVSETNPDGGTTASKHLTIPFTLEETATSIRVLVDAMRPVGTDFTIWYRTAQTTGATLIGDTSWIAFSKTVNPPNTSNYSELGITDYFRQYEFNVFNITDFDQYQVKITMNSTRSTKAPIFKNLRTIATV